MHTRIAHVDDIESVLILQDLYLYANLSEDGRKEGFVTTPFTPQQLAENIALDGLFVAEEGSHIVGYAFAGTWKYFEQWPIFPFMTSRFPQLQFKGGEITTQNSFQYGPVCLAKEHRGAGLFNQLFETLRIHWQTFFPLSITFINQANALSVRAHTHKLGWEVIDEFTFNDNQYYALAFDMNQSVL